MAWIRWTCCDASAAQLFIAFTPARSQRKVTYQLRVLDRLAAEDEVFLTELTKAGNRRGDTVRCHLVKKASWSRTCNSVIMRGLVVQKIRWMLRARPRLREMNICLEITHKQNNARLYNERSSTLAAKGRICVSWWILSSINRLHFSRFRFSL